MARSVGGREPGRAAQDRGETETESEPGPGQIRLSEGRHSKGVPWRLVFCCARQAAGCHRNTRVVQVAVGYEYDTDWGGAGSKPVVWCVVLSGRLVPKNFWGPFVH